MTSREEKRGRLNTRTDGKTRRQLQYGRPKGFVSHEGSGPSNRINSEQINGRANVSFSNRSYFLLGDSKAIFTLDSFGKAIRTNIRYRGADHTGIRTNQQQR